MRQLGDVNVAMQDSYLSPAKLKQELGKQYSGNTLWEKVTEAAKKNTNENAVGCFVAGTLVHTKEGLRPIQEIKVGDYVLSKLEDGNGETAYKRVVNTFEFEDKEAWFVSWNDPSLTSLLKLKTALGRQQYVDAHGQSFVVTTPNHPFWVVESDEELVSGYEEEFRLDLPRPVPQRQWVRADQLATGMTLLLADGRVVEVLHSKRVYKADQELQAWVPIDSDHTVGLLVNFENGQVRPHVGLFDWYLREPFPSTSDGLVNNPNDAYIYDMPEEPVPESWYMSKVYNLEVEDYHTYFVDKLGIWVHNTNCGKDQSVRLSENNKVFNSETELTDWLKTLSADELKGVRLVKETSYEQQERAKDNWKDFQETNGVSNCLPISRCFTSSHAGFITS